MGKFGDLFQDEPKQWGLRGDPHLWRDLREKLESVECPNNIVAAQRILENLFWEATGQTLTFCEDFYIENYGNGGMSSGQISGEFWRTRGFPLVLERLSIQLGSGKGNYEQR